VLVRYFTKLLINNLLLYRCYNAPHNYKAGEIVNEIGQKHLKNDIILIMSTEIKFTLNQTAAALATSAARAMDCMFDL
jgi:hypothetical protein